MKDKNYSNPASFFVTGDDTKDFTFEGGENPYHVFISSNHWIVLSVMIFANDEAHVIQILKDFVAFVFKCHQEKEDYNKTIHQYHRVPNNYVGRAESVLEAIKNNQVQITKIDKGQMYKIGWASNDTF